MKKEVVNSWLRFAAIIVCVGVALVLLIAELNKPYTGLLWLAVLIAIKLGAFAAGYVAYIEFNKLTSEIKK